MNRKRTSSRGQKTCQSRHLLGPPTLARFSADPLSDNGAIIRFSRPYFISRSHQSLKYRSLPLMNYAVLTCRGRLPGKSLRSFLAPLASVPFLLGFLRFRMCPSGSEAIRVNHAGFGKTRPTKTRRLLGKSSP